MKTFLDYTQDLDSTKTWFDSVTRWLLSYYISWKNLITNNFFENRLFVTKEDIEKKIKELDKKLFEIKKLKKEIINSNLPEIEKNFVFNNLNSIGLKFIMFKYSIYLEAEKWGFEIDDAKRIIYLKRVNKIQDIVYWPEISSDEWEKQRVLDEMYKKFLKWKSKLTETEQQSYLSFLQELWYSNFDFPNSWNRIQKEKKSTKNNNNSKLDLSKIFLTKQKIIHIFELLLDLYWLKQFKVSLESYTSFSVQKIENELESENWKYTHKLVIPKLKVEKTSLKKILELFDHEVWVHAIRWNNTFLTIKVIWDRYVNIEEWFATLSQKLFDENIDKVKVIPNIWHISSLVAEKYNWESCQKFFELYFKLTKPKDTSKDEIILLAKNRVIRIKKFVSLKEPWANRKDTSYTRWQTQVVDYLQSVIDVDRQKFLKDFYFSKLSFEDIWLVEEFRKSLWIDETELKYPLWIGKILYKKLLWEKVTLSWLQEEDFRFQVIEKFSIWVKRKIVRILQEIRWKKK